MQIDLSSLGFVSEAIGKASEFCCGLVGIIAGVAGIAVFLYLKKKHKKDNKTVA